MIMQYCTRLSGTMNNVNRQFFPQYTFMLLCIKITMVLTLSDTKVLPISFQVWQNSVNSASLALNYSLPWLYNFPSKILRKYLNSVKPGGLLKNPKL